MLVTNQGNAVTNYSRLEEVRFQESGGPWVSLFPGKEMINI